MTPYLLLLFAKLDLEVATMTEQKIALDRAKGIRATLRVLWRFGRAFVRFERVHAQIKAEVARLEAASS